MKRRDFFRITAAGLAGASLGAHGVRAATGPLPKKRSIQKGFMLGTFKTEPKREISVMEQFQMLKEAGFEGVEPPGGMNVEEVLKARDATGLKIPSVVVSTHWRSPLSDPDASVREVGLAGVRRALQDAKAYGARSVLLVPAVVKKEVPYDHADKRSRAEIRKVIPLAEELGVKIAIENVWNQFLLSPLEAARWVDDFGSTAVAWHFDVGNIINYGWPEQWIRILNDRIVALHIKEFSREKRDEQGLWKGFEVNLLEGDNDWPAVMQALDEIGYEGWGIVEQYRPPGMSDLAFLKDLSQRMDRIFAL